MPRQTDLAPLALSMTQAVAAFFTVMPKFSEVRRADPDHDFELKMDVRTGEISASVISLGIGGILAYYYRSPVPVYAASAIGIIIAVVYELALRQKARPS